MQFRGGMSELMRQASRMQRKLEQTRQELKGKTVEVSGANDKIKVVANCGKEIVRIDIDPEFAKTEELSMVQDALVGVLNAALKQAGETLESEMDKVTGGVKIPGMV